VFPPRTKMELLLIGKTLAHYKITSLVGKGGMGEVYRATDTKLGRDVAIKVIPGEMSQDPERLARFEREARTLATLQHANIASIYGFETANDVRFLVMELVDGEDLSERMQRGALPVDEAIDLARQLAEGLAAAHAVGIIHRDLKPANIKISSEGKLKILDFGLARAYADDSGSQSDIEHSPTVTAMTQAGVILGTAAYMSPEQARGKRADHRADIWAFGVVFFEMLAGQRLFEGETVSDTLAGVLRADVPWNQLPKNAPPRPGASWIVVSNAIRRAVSRPLPRHGSPWKIWKPGEATNRYRQQRQSAHALGANDSSGWHRRAMTSRRPRRSRSARMEAGLTRARWARG
jgi:eukaryotic-like serine/threonine-protein kinase